MSFHGLGFRFGGVTVCPGPPKVYGILELLIRSFFFVGWDSFFLLRSRNLLRTLYIYIYQYIYIYIYHKHAPPYAYPSKLEIAFREAHLSVC